MGKDLYSKTDKNEFFPTQEFLKNELYSELDKYNFKLILDPCCGDGGLEKFGQGYTYGLYDIEDRGTRRMTFPVTSTPTRSAWRPSTR